MIEIDGSMGEGGGQILRTALSLSVATGSPFRMTDIRANRSNPGLRPQHLTAVRAAADISGADTEGAAKNSRTLTFDPGPIRAGDYEFDIGTAGSAVLVLQTLLPALGSLADASQVTVEGGTHNQHAPIFEYLDGVYRPLLERLGPDIDMELQSHGFYPPGGGRLTAELRGPITPETPLQLLERGDLVELRATSVLADLPKRILSRELETLQKHLEVPLDEARKKVVDAPSPGNYLYVEIESENITEIVGVVGRKGLPAETVAVRVAEAVNDYLASGAPVGPHLADQLLLPMSLAGGGVYRACEVTTHADTQIELIPRFLPVEFERNRGENAVEIRVEGAG